MNDNYKSSLYMISSALFYSLQNLNVKLCNTYYSIWLILFFRGLISSIISISFIYALKIKPRLGTEKTRLLIRGVLGSTNLFLGLYSLVYLNLSLSTVIQSTSVIWFTIFAYLFYKEYWYFINNIGIIIVLFGILILFYNNEKNNKYGIFMALLSSIFNALANISIKDIKDESTFVIGFYSMSLCTIFSIPMYLLNNKNYEIDIINKYFFLLFLTGISSLIAQNLKNKSLQITNNLGIILLKNLDIVFSCLWDIYIFKYNFTCREIIGIIILLIGCFIRKY